MTAGTIAEALGQVPATRVLKAPEEGTGERHATRTVIELADRQTSDLGDVASAVAGAQTPHRDQIPPTSSLVLFAKDLDAAATHDLSQALADVAGVDAKAVEIDAKKGEILIPLKSVEDKHERGRLQQILAAIEKTGAKATADGALRDHRLTESSERKGRGESRLGTADGNSNESTQALVRARRLYARAESDENSKDYGEAFEHARDAWLKVKDHTDNAECQEYAGFLLKELDRLAEQANAAYKDLTPGNLFGKPLLEQ